MTKPHMTLLFHDKKVFIFLMICVDFRTRQGRKLQLPFMCCLAPPCRQDCFLPSSLDLLWHRFHRSRWPTRALRLGEGSPSPAPPAAGHHRQGGDSIRGSAPGPPTREGTRREAEGRARSRESCRMYRAAHAPGMWREKLCKASVWAETRVRRSPAGLQLLGTAGEPQRCGTEEQSPPGGTGSGEGGRGQPQGGPGSRERCPGFSPQSLRVALRGSSDPAGDGRALPGWKRGGPAAPGESVPAPAGCCGCPRRPLRCGSPAQHSIIRAVITAIYLYRAPHARVSRVVF